MSDKFQEEFHEESHRRYVRYNAGIHDKYIYMLINTGNTAQGGGGSFKNRKLIGEVGCCESGMAERIK